ncbi:MAG TPA: hypothetical protein ENI02_02960 [Candidatus Aminicenantes bacterium]|nr:hypothetical protein [Candidatus Aminicenantes bacterium]
MKKIEETAKLLEQAKSKMMELSVDLEKLNESHRENIVNHFFDLGLKFEDSELKDFFHKPYILLPKEKQEWYCIVPSFINFQVGYFDRREGNYNIYIINKYSRWMNDIPKLMLDEIDLETPENIYVKDGELRFDENLLDTVRTKFGHRIKDLQKDSAKIKQGHEFELIAELIEDGNLPFIAKPVNAEDLRDPQITFDMSGKYVFQEDVYKEFLKKGAIGVYWMTGAGKSFLGMRVLDSLKYDEKEKRKLLVTPTTTLVDQWKMYFEQFAPRLLDEVDIITYNSFHKVKDKKYICTIFDECDRLPADTFSRFSMIETKYRVGLSATPYREDGRTNYIFALTGYPFGLDWGSLIKILEKKLHTINVFILKSEKDKVRKIQELLDVNRKTLIFSDSISLGKEISKKFDVPFIFGSTKKRLEVLEGNKVNVVSRVMDYGVSIKDLKHIIEADFLFGSRKQQVQRTGRLLHSLGKDSRHDILFSVSEFEKYKKRLFGLMEKGFKIRFFNEASKQRVKIDEEDLRPMSRIKLPDKKKEAPAPGIEPGAEPRFPKEYPATFIESHSKVDYETFLKNEIVKKLIKEAIADKRSSPRHIKGTLALILQLKRAVTFEEVKKSLGLADNTSIIKACTSLDKYNLITKVMKDKFMYVDFNIKGISEIAELSSQREKSQKIIDELFEE